jgi:hypothetical protein
MGLFEVGVHVPWLAGEVRMRLCAGRLDEGRRATRTITRRDGATRKRRGEREAARCGRQRWMTSWANGGRVRQEEGVRRKLSAERRWSDDVWGAEIRLSEVVADTKLRHCDNKASE